MATDTQKYGAKSAGTTAEAEAYKATIWKLERSNADLLAALEAVLSTSQGPTKMRNETEAEYEAALLRYRHAVEDGVAAINKAKGQ